MKNCFILYKLVFWLAFNYFNSNVLFLRDQQQQIANSMWILGGIILLVYGNSEKMGFVEAGVLDYNWMNCIDLARHMGGTVPSRFGLFGNNVAPGAKRQSEAGEVVAGSTSAAASSLPAPVQSLINSATNGASAANCAAAERHTACVSTDQFLEQNFPAWFFDYQVTNNVNHIVGQLTKSRMHSLFEMFLKLYKCFCEC